MIESFIKILYDSPYYSNKRRYNFLLLPSIDGTRSLYFKEWIRKHFKEKVPLMICYKFFDNLTELKKLLDDNDLYIRRKKDFSIDWRKTLWVINQILKSFKKRAIIKDIVVGIEKTNYLAIENRSEAIRLALKMAEPGDVVVLAGKGHETYQINNEGVIHFDEREVVDEILSGK